MKKITLLLAVSTFAWSTLVFAAPQSNEDPKQNDKGQETAEQVKAKAEQAKSERDALREQMKSEKEALRKEREAQRDKLQAEKDAAKKKDKDAKKDGDNGDY